MSSTAETRDVVTRMYQAGIEGDPEAFMACIHPECELEEPAWLPYGGTHSGLEALGNIFAEVGKIIDLSTIELDAVVADGDTAVGFFHAKLHSGAETVNAEHWTVQDGKIRRGRVFYMDPTPVQEMIGR